MAADGIIKADRGKQPTAKGQAMKLESARYWDHEANRPELVEVEAKEGSRICLDADSGAKFYGLTVDHDTYTDSGWPGCQFRLTGHLQPLGVNIHFVGRKERTNCSVKGYGGLSGVWCRIRVEFVGDCEPSTFCDGFLHIRD